MEDHPSLPEPTVPASVSYRQLAERLRQAPAEAEPREALLQRTAGPAPDDSLEAVVADWARSSRRLLELLQRRGAELSRGRTPRQMMALGALQAHLAMALQAHAVSGRRSDDR